MTPLSDHLNKVYPFTVIAETGSLYQAAKKLHTSQPGLSLLVRNLELSLNQKLFLRTSKGMILTPSGERFYEMGKRVLDEVERFQSGHTKANTKLRFASYDGIAHMVGQKLSEVHQFKELSIETLPTGLAMLDQLKENKIDLAIIADPPKIPGYQYERITRSPYGLYCNPQVFKQLPEEPVDLSIALANIPLIYVRDSTLYHKASGERESQKTSIESLINKYSLGEREVIVSDSCLLAYNLCLKGAGVGLFVAGQILPYLIEKSLLPVNHPHMSFPLSSLLYTVHRFDEKELNLAPIKATLQNVFKEARELYFSLQ